MVSADANIIIGTAVDETLKDDIKVTLIATGLEGGRKAENDRYAKYAAQAQALPRRTSDAGDEAVTARRLRPRMSSSNTEGFFNR